MSLTRDEIAEAIYSVTGNPSVGVVHDITPGIVDALDARLNPKPKIERAVVKPAETR